MLLSWLKQSFQTPKQTDPSPVPEPPKPPFQPSLADNMAYLDTAFEGSEDLVKKIYEVGGRRVAMAGVDNLYKKEQLSRAITGKLLAANNLPEDANACFDYLRTQVAEPIDVTEVTDWDTALFMLMSGFVLFFMDGVARVLAFGLQDFATRGVSEPDNEVMERGSKEGFCEVLRINLSLIRRRLKTPTLMFETMRHRKGKQHGGRFVLPAGAGSARNTKQGETTAAIGQNGCGSRIGISSAIFGRKPPVVGFHRRGNRTPRYVMRQNQRGASRGAGGRHPLCPDRPLSIYRELSKHG